MNPYANISKAFFLESTVSAEEQRQIWLACAKMYNVIHTISEALEDRVADSLQKRLVGEETAQDLEADIDDYIGLLHKDLKRALHSKGETYDFGG